ncbi:unnamed protein product [Sphagnum balticum]
MQQKQELERLMKMHNIDQQQVVARGAAAAREKAQARYDATAVAAAQRTEVVGVKAECLQTDRRYYDFYHKRK